MPQYVLLLRTNDEAWAKLSPEEIQKKIEKYISWRNMTFVVGGAGLDRKSGRVIQKKDDGVSVTEGPFCESREVMAGYYIIEAASYEEAVTLSLDGPHADMGTIEIREVLVYNT